MTAPRTVVTAHASWTALGHDPARVREACEHGLSGLAAPSVPLPFATITGEVRETLPTLPDRLRSHESRVGRLAFGLSQDLASAVARVRARVGRERIAIVLGSSTGGLERSEAAVDALVRDGAILGSYDFVKQHAMHAMLDVVADVLEIAGPRYVVSTACSSGAKAFAAGRRLIRSGIVDAAIVGGIDGLCQTTLRGFHALGILGTTACRPFSAERGGMNIGEGGALALLERDGDGPVALLGVGESTDAYHVSAPDPEGAGAAEALRRALADAGLASSAIDHVNAHGTGTKQNDASEARAIAAVLGSDVPVTSTKALTGHLLGAAGAVEAVFAMMAIEHGFVPPTVGLDPQDPTLAVRVVDRVLRAPQRHVVSTSLAFGGSNVALVFGRSS